MKIKIFWLIGLALLLAACKPLNINMTITPQPSSTGSLMVYSGPSATATLTATSANTSTPLPTPTPTPRTHTVIKGEDMFGISLRYGIPLEQLRTANPTINPYFLSVGAVLVIPAPLNTPTPDPGSPPLPTPLPVRLEQPVCYPSGDGGLWCFARVTNLLETASEGVTAAVRLYDRGSGEIRSQIMAPFLNRLSPGGYLPLAIYFAAPVPADFETSAELISALPLADGSQRYLDVQTADLVIEIAGDGRSAEVRGSLRLADQSRRAGRVAVSVIAFDSSDHITGLRHWDWTGTIEPDALVDFTLFVYAAGGAIERIDVLTEALPEELP